MHNIFYISLLEQETTKKRQVDKKFGQIEFDSRDNNKEYKVEVIQDNVVYVKELKGYLLELNYLVSCKDYLKKENT